MPGWLCLALLIGFAALRVADPAPGRGNSRQDLRRLPAHRSAQEDRKAGHHRRYRRQEPGKARPVAVAADADRRHRHQLTRLGAVVIAFDAVFSEPDRLNPDIAADTFRNLDEETRAKLRALPSNDQIFADAIRRRAWCWANPDLPKNSIRARQDASGDGAGDARRGAAALHVRFPGLLRNVKVLEQPRPGAACSRSSPSATASCGGCR
jgi:adenylate cyclase